MSNNTSVYSIAAHKAAAPRQNGIKHSICDLLKENNSLTLAEMAVMLRKKEGSLCAAVSAMESVGCLQIVGSAQNLGGELAGLYALADESLMNSSVKTDAWINAQTASALKKLYQLFADCGLELQAIRAFYKEKGGLDSDRAVADYNLNKEGKVA